MKDKSTNIKNIVCEAFISIASLSLIIVSIFCFSSSTFILKNTEINLMKNWLNDSSDNYVYTSTSLAIDNDTSNLTNDFFSRVYPKNMDGTQTSVISISDNSGISHFSISYNDFVIPYQTAVTNGRVYSNNQEPARFETVDINLYKFRDKSEELSYDSSTYNGFVYLPDTIANSIIENNDSLSTYDDLINNAKDNIFYINGNGVSFKYKIANIFHLDGFNLDYSDLTEYKYTDNNNAAKLSKYLGYFCFIYNSNSFATANDRYFNTVTTMMGTKKYVLKEYFEKAQNVCKNKADASLRSNRIYKIDKENNLKEYERSADFNKAFFESKDGWNYLYVPLIVMLVLFNISVVIYVLQSKNDKRVGRFSLINASVLVGYLFVAFVLKKIFYLSFGVLTFFNSISLGLIALLALVLLLVFIETTFLGDPKEKEIVKK